MPLTRRTFMGRMALAAGVLPAQRAVAASTPGGLSERTVLGIRKLAEVYGGVPFNPDTTFTETRYEQYFAHRARRSPRLRDALDSRFKRLEALARECHGRAFHECPPAECLRLVARAFPASGRGGGCEGAADAVSKTFLDEVQRPILAVYLRTDAWTDMGYHAWPGRPRGLEAYRQPPGAVEP